MESPRQERKIVVKTKKEQIKELRNNIEALLFHFIVLIVLLGSLNIGFKSIGYDLISKIPYGFDKITNYVIGVSAVIFGYWYISHRILLENAK